MWTRIKCWLRLAEPDLPALTDAQVEHSLRVERRYTMVRETGLSGTPNWSVD